MEEAFSRRTNHQYPAQGRSRDEYLNERWFSNILHTRKIINGCGQDYQECRLISRISAIFR